MGYLHKAIRPLNINSTNRRRSCNLQNVQSTRAKNLLCGCWKLTKQKAEQYMKDLMVRYRNKLSYDPKTGQIKDDWNHNSMLEDFWIPRRDGGRGTEITTLDGDNN